MPSTRLATQRRLARAAEPRPRRRRTRARSPTHLGRFATGVALSRQRRTASLVNSLTSVSLESPLASLCQLRATAALSAQADSTPALRRGRSLLTLAQRTRSRCPSGSLTGSCSRARTRSRACQAPTVSKRLTPISAPLLPEALALNTQALTAGLRLAASCGRVAALPASA